MDEIASEDAQAAEQSRGKRVVHDLFPQADSARLSPRQQRGASGQADGAASAVCPRGAAALQAHSGPAGWVSLLAPGTDVTACPTTRQKSDRTCAEGHIAPSALCTNSAAATYADPQPHDCCTDRHARSTLPGCLACSASACHKEASVCADARRQPDLSSMGMLARAQDIRAQRALPSVPRLEPLAAPQVPDFHKVELRSSS